MALGVQFHMRHFRFFEPLWIPISPFSPRLMANTHAKLLLSTLFFQMAVTQGCLARVVLPVIYQQPRNGFHLPSFMFSLPQIYIQRRAAFFIRFYEIDFMATSSKVQFVI